MRTLILMPFLVLVAFSCKEGKTGDYTSLETIRQEQTHPGKKLMETNCYVCHSPTASHDDRLGPPMIAIKKHYINGDTTKEEFISALQTWIKDPNEENAKMFGAVRRFGVMPKAPYPEETIEQIADYMFDHDIEQPEWFEEHFKEQRGKGMGNGRNSRKGKGKGQKE